MKSLLKRLIILINDSLTERNINIFCILVIAATIFYNAGFRDGLCILGVFAVLFVVGIAIGVVMIFVCVMVASGFKRLVKWAMKD